MKLTLMVESKRVEDGEDSTVLLTKDDLLTVEDFLYAYGQFLRAAGFTYVENVGATTTDGKDEFWSGF